MSIDHKAYLFRHDEFQRELAPLLYGSLKAGDVGPLRDFVNAHQESLTDPATEESLADDWEQLLADHPDVQWYADLALTRYYDLTDNLGLSRGFDALGSFFRSLPELGPNSDRLFCGWLFGPKGKRLDPGRMGTGLVATGAAAQIADLLARLAWPVIPGPESEIYSTCHYRPHSAAEVQRSLTELRQLYHRATAAGLGILFSDFNDSGVWRL